MTIPYHKRKQYFRNYYQKNKGVKSVNNSVKINTLECSQCLVLKKLLKKYQEKELLNRKPRPLFLNKKTNNSSTKKITLRISTQLLNDIKNKYSNFSDFLRQSLLAYQAQQLTPSQNRYYQNKQELTKLTVRLDKSLENLYTSLPENKKTEILNQILGGYWENRCN